MTFNKTLKLAFALTCLLCTPFGPTHAQDTDIPKYERKAFGSSWADTDRDCQNTRAELLVELSINPVSYRRSDGCVVARGAWRSFFTLNYVNEASKVDIDHVVPLHWAWQHGAHAWSKSKRVRFSNDYANLVVVESNLNRSKGSKGIDRWMPPTNQCQYTLRFIRVVKKYRLAVSSREADAFERAKQRYC